MWGYANSDVVESVQRLFVKKLFRLPFNTPNYVLYLETGLNLLYFYTLKLNLNYICNVFRLPNSRLPKILAEQIVEKNISWCKDWRILGRKQGFEINFNLQDPVEIRNQMCRVLEGELAFWRAECVGRARTSRFHQHYLSLDLELGGSLALRSINNIRVASWIIKARAGVIDLNFKPWFEGRNYMCSLCSWHEHETVFHFVARCPILAGLRKSLLGKSTIELNEFFQLLNGRDWWALAKYLSAAWKLRWELVNEFNF